jgi:predicted DCC family thiol-disulfide oxidoreductase YuxK/uncharacterized membrane protein YphA (DoxX/SURF4 family)
MKPGDTGKKTIVYDGLCTMCKGVTAAIDNSSKSGQFKKTDLHARRLPAGITREAAEREIHVIAADGTVWRGAQGVLQILAEYPRLAWLVPIGRLPGVRQLLALLYRFVASRRHFIVGPAARIFWVKFVVAAAFFAGLLLSFRLWLGERSAPLVPLFDGLPGMGHPWDFVVYGLLLALLAAVMVTAKPRRYIAALLGLGLVWCLLDQLRWQPWVFQYGALLGLLALFSWKADDVRRTHYLVLARIILGATYLWSGLHKFNPAFVYDTFPWMLQPVTDHLPHSWHDPLVALGVGVPILELGLGALLITGRLQRLAVWLAVAMHAGILLLIGPLGHGWNMVVWPWNIAMALLVVILCWRPLPAARWREFTKRARAAAAGVLVLFCLMPALSLVGLWDSYLSSALYSGDIPRAVVSLRGSVALPPGIARHAKHNEATQVISVTNWLVGDLGVPPYPELRVYKSLGRSFCQYDQSSILLVARTAAPGREAFQAVYSCADLPRR